MNIRKILFFTGYYLREFIRYNSPGLLLASLIYPILLLFNPLGFNSWQYLMLTFLCLLPFSLYYLWLPKSKKYLFLDKELNSYELFLTSLTVNSPNPYSQIIKENKQKVINSNYLKIFFRHLPLKVISIATTIFLATTLLSHNLSASFLAGEKPGNEWQSQEQEFLGMPEEDQLTSLPRPTRRNIFNPDINTPDDGTPPVPEKQSDEVADKVTAATLEEELRKSMEILTEKLSQELKNPPAEVKEKLNELNQAVKEQDFQKALALMNPLISMLEEARKSPDSASAEEGGQEGEELIQGSGTAGAGSGPFVEARPGKTGSGTNNKTTDEQKATSSTITIPRKSAEDTALNPVNSLDELKLFKDIFTLKLRPTTGLREELAASMLMKIKLSQAEALLYLNSKPLPPRQQRIIRNYFELITP